ncbi:MAG: tRNA-dihydrouridine synthase family protein, partial [Spirochaetales bacterium]
MPEKPVSSLYHSLDLPGIRMPGNIFLAPLAGYTDRSFRLSCSEFGADLTYTEMVSALGIYHNSRKTVALFEKSPEEPFKAVQIFAPGPEFLADITPALLAQSPALIDINCGCPVPKVVKTGAGAALMKEPKKIGAMVKALKDAVSILGSTVQVTVKLRSGLDANSINFLECAREAAEAGASMLCLHPRTRSQGYGGSAEWAHLALLKEAVPVPVFGSGDLFTAQDVERMLRETGCDGVMVARG